MAGRHCPLAKLCYSRDERRANPQIVFGLLSGAEGCPVAVEVFDGNTGDPKTVAAQRVSALRAPRIHKLAVPGALPMSLFDQQDLAEIQHPDHPGERLVVRRNPLLAAERARKRGELIAAAKRKRQPLRGQDKIGYLTGKALATSKVDKYFRWQVTSAGLDWERDQARIGVDARLDGIYVLGAHIPAEQLDRDQTVPAYKRQAQVERAFRSLKSVDLHVRLIHHRLAQRLRAHILIAMLASYVERNMRRALRRCCSMTNCAAPQELPPSLRPKGLLKLLPKRAPNGPMTSGRYTVFKTGRRTWRPSPRTASNPWPPTCHPSISPPARRPRNSARPTCSASKWSQSIRPTPRPSAAVSTQGVEEGVGLRPNCRS